MSFKISEHKELLSYFLVSLGITIIFAYALFVIAGIRILFGILFVSFPLYLILDNFDLNDGEKIVFALLLGITVFPSLAYALGLFISFKISIIIIFLLLLVVGFMLRKFFKRKS